MGKVDAFTISGFDLFFYSSDHLPPHLHVRKAGEWELRVYLMTSTGRSLDYEVKWPKSFSGPKSKVRKLLREKIVKHKEQLLVEWEEKVDY